MPEPPERYPTTSYSYTGKDGTTHEVVAWWDAETVCERRFVAMIDAPTRPVTCVFCLIDEADPGGPWDG